MYEGPSFVLNSIHGFLKKELVLCVFDGSVLYVLCFDFFSQMLAIRLEENEAFSAWVMGHNSNLDKATDDLKCVCMCVCMCVCIYIY